MVGLLDSKHYWSLKGCIIRALWAEERVREWGISYPDLEGTRPLGVCGEPMGG